MKKSMFSGASKEIFQRAKDLRKRETHAEDILWGYLKTKPFDNKFRRQHPYATYILDFYCHQLKLVIEVDGSIHNDEEVIKRDRERQTILEEAGLGIMRFKNEEVQLTLEKVIAKIETKLNKMKESIVNDPQRGCSPLGAGGVLSRIYLDNAATTPLSPEVLEAMMPYLSDHFGNPSSIYSYGRETRMAIENSRKSVAKLLGVKPGNIFFTSGGTESNNTAIAASIRDLGCTHIITSPIEHHAVLHTVEHYCSCNKISTSFVNLTEDGAVDIDDLEKGLKEQRAAGKKTLVSLMHANNEIGVLLDIKRVGELCKQYGAIFHSDCVQTVGHYPVNLSEIGVHFISGAAHKFHGPKGAGILYVSNEVNIKPFIFGGGQERNMRAGTENVYGIVGFAKALEIAMRDYEKERTYIKQLKAYMKQSLQQNIPGVGFNDSPDSLYTVLSVCFPKTEKSDFLLMSLDMASICVSGGSACSSGADAGSHVIKALQRINDCTTIRFSFSKYNAKEEVDRVVEKLKELV